MTAMHSSSSPTSQTQTERSREQLATSAPSLENPTLLHSFSCPSSVVTHSHAPSASSSSHRHTVLSNDALASVSPDGCQSIARIVRRCPVGTDVWNWNVGAPPSEGVLYVYSRIVRSVPHEASRLRCGLKATPHAASSCPGRFATSTNRMIRVLCRAVFFRQI